MGLHFSVPQGMIILLPFHTPLLSFISGHGSSLDYREESLVVIQGDQNPRISFPFWGSCCCQEAAPQAQTHLAHLLSLLCMHPDWLVFTCVGKNERQLHLPPIFVTLPFPPLLCFLHSPASSPKPAAHHRASSHWLEPQERQLTLQGQTIGKREQVLPNLCKNYRRNFNSCLRSTMLFSPFKP